MALKNHVVTNHVDVFNALMTESIQIMLNPFFSVMFQLCLVSILGFVLYCITYVPDERTSKQFIVKVSLAKAW